MRATSIQPGHGSRPLGASPGWQCPRPHGCETALALFRLFLVCAFVFPGVKLISLLKKKKKAL